MQAKQYFPPTEDNCNALFYALSVITYEHGFDIKFFPNEILRKTFFPKEDVTTVIYGATVPSIRMIFINNSVKSCGKARNLAHELGHVVSVYVDDNFAEVVAELIQFGLLDEIYKNRSFDIRYSTATYLSAFQEDSDKSVTLGKISKKQMETIKTAVLSGVKKLLEGEK